MNLFFSDFFEVKPKTLEKYAAFNISLISDLPLFIDPFLLFNSSKRAYKRLHKDIIKYLAFLRDKNLKHQVKIYQKASDATHPPIKVIVYFSKAELAKVTAILQRLKLTESEDIVLIDARKDNKPSGSKARDS